MAEIEVYVVVDSNGDFAIGTDEEEVHENYKEQIGTENVTKRCVEVSINVSEPEEVEEGPSVSVPAHAGKISTAA